MPTDLLSGAKAVGSGIGSALDAQRWALAKGVTGEKDPDKQREAYRGMAGLSGIYPSLPRPVKGLVDFGVDTVVDPVTYETMFAGPLVKGAGLLGKALSPLSRAAGKIVPQAVKVAAKDAGEIAQTVRHGLTRNLVPGGAAVGDLENQRGRGARDLLLGASGKHALNEAEMKRAFVKRFDDTIKPLDPNEETNVYKTLNGERGAQGLNPKETEAFEGLRKIEDEAAYSEATPTLRWLISLRQGGLRGGQRGKTITTKAPSLLPIDPALAPEQQRIIAESKLARGKGSPRLSQALYPLGREVRTARNTPTPGKHDIEDLFEEPASREPISARIPESPTAANLKESLRELDAAHGAASRLSTNVHESGLGSTVDQVAHRIAAERHARPAGSNLTVIGEGENTKTLGGRTMGSSPYTKAEIAEMRSALRKGNTKHATDADAIRTLDAAFNETGKAREEVDRVARSYGIHTANMSPENVARSIQETRDLFARESGAVTREAEESPDLERAYSSASLPFYHSQSRVLTNPLEDEILATEPYRKSPRLWRSVQRAKVAPLELSPDIKEFVGPGGRREEYRWRYLPGYSERAAAESPDREAFEVNPLNWENPNLKEREDFRVDPKKHEQQRKAFRSMLGNAARESSTASLRRELPAKGLPITPNVEAAMEKRIKAKGSEREGPQKLEDAWKGLLQYGRAAQVGLTPFHAANIAALQLAHAPTTIPEAIGTTARAFLPGANRHEIFREGREMGALGPSQERLPLFQNVPLAVRAGVGGATGGTAGFAQGKDTPLPERFEHAGLGALAGAAAGGILPKWSKAMNDLVFTYDDAAKQALARNYARRGMTKPYQAGRQAAEDLVDYTNPSELGKKLSWVSKFPTYRSQLPFAALRGIAKNPARFEALNRASQGVLGGGTAQTPIGPVKSYASTADVGRAVGDPKGYARSALSEPVKIALSLAEKFNVIPKQQWKYYFTYKLDPTSKAVLLSAALAGLPEARNILDETGNGMFKQQPGSSPLNGPERAGIFDTTSLSVGR